MDRCLDRFFLGLTCLFRIKYAKTGQNGEILAGYLVRAVTYTESLSKVPVPPQGVTLAGITPEGVIAPPEYPDRPTEMRPASHLVEFPPAAWEDQRAEALRWGDRDPARWGDDPPPKSPRPMAERLAGWEREVAAVAKQYAQNRKATEEIYQPHGIFEQAMPARAQLDRIAFRSEVQYIESALRHHLAWVAERLLLDHPVAARKQAVLRPRKARVRSEGEPEPQGRGLPIQRERSRAQTRRSSELHQECDPALQFLGWSPHNWADQTDGEVGHSAVDRILSGHTASMRESTRSHLFKAMKEALRTHNRLDLLMKSPRWAGKTAGPHSFQTR